MSGGQRQRVAAARAIINDPALILAVEPTGALDSKSARMLMECLSSLNTAMGATILMETTMLSPPALPQDTLHTRTGTYSTSL
jgi:putative ABC transport system ATP-binding protein